VLGLTFLRAPVWETDRWKTIASTTQWAPNRSASSSITSGRATASE
jgi:hypothetical protein